MVEDNEWPLYETFGGRYYTIKQKIGHHREGSLVSVYSALDNNEFNPRTVALKITIFPWSEENQELWTKRIKRDTHTWVQFENNCPEILKLYGVIKHRIYLQEKEFGVIIIVMEYAEKGDLKNFMQSKPAEMERLPTIDLFGLLIPIAVAVKRGHDINALHKDIKSNNIFLCSDPMSPLGVHPKLGDFGIAQKLGEASDGAGTLPYMPAEAFKSNYKLDFTYDIYSLGILFFEVCTGKCPYHIASNRLMSATQRRREYEKLHESGDVSFETLEKKHGQQLARLIRSMLSISPNSRPSIGNVLNDLQNIREMLMRDNYEKTETGKYNRNEYKWNPNLHLSLNEHLRYYFICERNAKIDSKLLKNSLSAARSDRYGEPVGFAIHRVVGGIDFILRVWVNTETEQIVRGVLVDFRQDQRRPFDTFVVHNIHYVESKALKDLDLHLSNQSDVGEMVYRQLSESAELEYKKLKKAKLVVNNHHNKTLSKYPLRIFVAFRMRGAIKNQLRFYAETLFAKLEKSLRSKIICNLCLYSGEISSSEEALPGMLLKLRLQRFQDYEKLWFSFLDAFEEVHPGLVFTVQSFVELTKDAVVESDDGLIWAAVESYRINNSKPIVRK
jgi:serine/threonine protein kinase